MSIITEGQTIRFVFFKIYSLVRASTTGRTCDRKGKCASEQCSCKKMEFFVRQNVIQNEVVVKIWVNRVKDLDL